MISRCSSPAWCFAVLATLLVAVPETVLAQRTTLPPSMVRVSSDSIHIGMQLRLASKLGNEALQAYSAAEETGPKEELDDIVQICRNVYTLIRAARAGMEHQKWERKTTEPLLEYAYKETTDAWNLSRTPVDRFSAGNSRAAYLAESIRDLNQAMRHVDVVLRLSLFR